MLLYKKQSFMFYDYFSFFFSKYYCICRVEHNLFFLNTQSTHVSSFTLLRTLVLVTSNKEHYIVLRNLTDYGKYVQYRLFFNRKF